MAPGSVLIATIPGDWPWGEGPCWTLTMDCSYPNSHQVAGLPIFKWMGTRCWEIRLADEFVYSSIIYSFMVFIPQALWTPSMHQQALCWV